MFGCALGLSDLMTGMSIVALGTSLPDTFASQYAAIHDDTAVSVCVGGGGGGGSRLGRWGGEEELSLHC